MTRPFSGPRGLTPGKRAGLAHLSIHRLACLFCALLLVACASATATTTSGIYGQVLIGPTCPVERPDLPCPDKPFQATIQVLDQNRRKVAEFQTDTLGNFHIGLKPGTYTLVAAAPGGGLYPIGREQTVTVTGGLFLRVTITLDSGIR